MLQARVSRAEAAVVRARQDIGAVVEAHTIDARDAEELGLLP
jgi:hypothetical protein